MKKIIAIVLGVIMGLVVFYPINLISKALEGRQSEDLTILLLTVLFQIASLVVGWIVGRKTYKMIMKIGSKSQISYEDK